MAGAQWLPLFEYSNKYRVSVSTLRRRIKLDEIQFRLDNGKYLLLDTPPERNVRETEKREKTVAFVSQPPADYDWVEEERPEPIADTSFATAQTLLEEIKKAYAQILQEKDEQIRLLKEEISNLKTLARVLEGEHFSLE